MKSIKNLISNNSSLDNQIPMNDNQIFDIHSLITKEEITEPKNINEINITCIIIEKIKNNLRPESKKNNDKKVINENENSTSAISTKTQNSQENNINENLNKKRKRNYSIFINKRRKKKKNMNKEIIKNEKKSIKKGEKINLIHENIKKKYTNEQYLKDLNTLNDNQSYNFMKENFPSMFNHINFYLYHKLLIERRKNKNNFLSQNYLMENYNIKNIIQPLNYNENLNEKLPEKVWSPPSNKINIEDFYKKCINIWPFNKCNFIKEIGLEYLMKNEYNIDSCLENLDKFVEFMIEKIKLKNYQLINKKEKIIKNYHLRNSKK